MITCPLCNTPVKDPTDQKPVQDGHANNFYCPNYIEIHAPTQDNPVGKRICHLSRRQLPHLVDGATAYTYQAIIPPYQIVWIANGRVHVYKLTSDGDRDGAPIYSSKSPVTYNAFLKTCQRFKVLVPFS